MMINHSFSFLGWIRLLSIYFSVGCVILQIGHFVNAGDIKVAALDSSLLSTGLKNLGNTCYMNSQLQCAFHIPAVRHIAMLDEEVEVQVPIEETEEYNDEELETDSDEKPGTRTIKKVVQPNDSLLALRELFSSMILAADNKLPAVMPRSFCMKLGIPVMVQQDSQEFWKLLLPAVEREAISDLYKGSFESYIKALDGSGREKRREELFLDLSLDITSSSDLLGSLRDSFGEPELLSEAEGNGWRPEKGADKVDAHKGSSLIAEGLPPILQCHLKRFNYDWQTDTMTKLNDRFEFPDILNLSSVCKPDEELDDEVLYDLQSIVVHMGEYGVGHYYSYVRPDVTKDDWYRFNDDIVEQVSFQEVVDDAFGGKKVGTKDGNRQGGFFGRFRRLFQGSGENLYGWGGRLSNAYVVQYVRRSELKTLYPN